MKNKFEIERKERIQKVYDYAFDLINAQVPKAPHYLKVAMTRELLLAANGNR